MDNMLDYIVVGGGIAGLYANYKLSHDLKLKGILLEKENDLGGRALEVNFHGRPIKLGAGVMCDENKHLMTLLNKLKIKPNYFDS
jgi:protoporphyrinogen oxidase